jgi:hypothetical protein
MKKLLVIQVAAFGHAWARAAWCAHGGRPAAAPARAGFSALTCTAQASLRTGLAPGAHGVVANGFFDPLLRRAAFWEQSCALVQGPRIWQTFRDRGGTVGLTFFQQSLGEPVDLLFSPAPIHTHGGGMIMGCYAGRMAWRPASPRMPRRLRLSQYWGRWPRSSPRSGSPKPSPAARRAGRAGPALHLPAAWIMTFSVSAGAPAQPARPPAVHAELERLLP